MDDGWLGFQALRPSGMGSCDGGSQSFATPISNDGS